MGIDRSKAGCRDAAIHGTMGICMADFRRICPNYRHLVVCSETRIKPEDCPNLHQKLHHNQNEYNLLVRLSTEGHIYVCQERLRVFASGGGA